MAEIPTGCAVSHPTPFHPLLNMVSTALMSRPTLALGWAPASPKGSYHIQTTNQEPHIIGSVPDLILNTTERTLLERVRKLRQSKMSGFQDAFWDLQQTYEARLKQLQEAGALSPGSLFAAHHQGHRRPVPAGSCLVCACLPVRAASGLCHRLWAARWLRRAGWDVRVDGVRWGALRDHGEKQLSDQWGQHLFDLFWAGFRVEQHRLPIVTPRYCWWRIGAQIFKQEKEVGRVWGEGQMIDDAYSRALWALRVWASDQNLGLSP